MGEFDPYYTLDCRDGKHGACDACDCNCHKIGVETVPIKYESAHHALRGDRNPWFIPSIVLGMNLLAGLAIATFAFITE